MPFYTTYAGRAGYDAAVLRPGKFDGRVFLPALGEGLTQQATSLLGLRAQYVLNYHHYSLVMHKTRHFAIYSAANVNFTGRFVLARPKDVWRIDRGHLPRREDLEYEANKATALACADDTCHRTNCTPQAAKFK